MHSSADKQLSEEEETLLEHGHSSSRHSVTRGNSLWSIVTIAVLSVLLAISLITHPLFRHLSTALGNSEKDRLCQTHTTVFPSPVEQDVDITWTESPVNGSFKKQTIYRGLPSPEVDQAWADLGAYLTSFIIPEDEIEQYGLHPGMVKRVPEQGGGYVAILETTHHIHCLNVMRQASHFDYPHYRAEGLASGSSLFADTEDVIRLHFSHCLDILRQRLMCTADTNVCGQVWVDDFGPLVFPTVNRKCRNYDQINQWAHEHAVVPFKDIQVARRPGDLVYSEFP